MRTKAARTLAETATPCPRCGGENTESRYGGERGETGPWLYCRDCNFDEAELKVAGADEAVTHAPDPDGWLPLDAGEAGWMTGDWVEVRSPGNPPIRAAVTRTRIYDRVRRCWATGSVWHGTAGRLMFKPTEYRVIT